MSSLFAKATEGRYREVRVDGVVFRLRRAHGAHLADLSTLRLALIRPAADLLYGTKDQALLEIKDPEERQRAVQGAVIQRWLRDLLESPDGGARMAEQNDRMLGVVCASVVAMRLADDPESWEKARVVMSPDDENEKTNTIWIMSLSSTARNALSAAAMDHTLGEEVRQQAESFREGPGPDGAD